MVSKEEQIASTSYKESCGYKSEGLEDNVIDSFEGRLCVDDEEKDDLETLVDMEKGDIFKTFIFGQ